MLPSLLSREKSKLANPNDHAQVEHFQHIPSSRSMPSAGCMMDDGISSSTKASWSDVCNRIILLPYLYSSTAEVSQKSNDMMTCITNIQTQIIKFHDVFTLIKGSLVLSTYERELFKNKTFQCAQLDSYKGEAIAEAFHGVAGDEGIFTLIIFFRHSRNFLRQWKNISTECRPWIIKKSVDLLKKQCVLELPQGMVYSQFTNRMSQS